MATRLTIYLLGGVSFSLDGRPLAGFGSRTAEAVLIYLASHPQPLPRSLLADFFWDERDEPHALANLRAVLSLLRKEVADYLVVTRDTVAFNHAADYWLDTAEFERRLAPLARSLPAPGDEAMAGELEAALNLYRGDFLAGFHLNESRGFEEWAALARERLRRLAGSGWQWLVDHYLASGQYAAGIACGERLLALDPYDEGVQRQMMWLLARSGQRHAALQQYQALRRLLSEELDVEPAPATTAVYERIRALAMPPPRHLPAEPTPFVGRQRELAEVERLLARPGCRLLTILGPGGIGKTRLALEVARRITERRLGQFLDGVYFVSLARLPSADFLTTSLAETLDFVFQGAEPSQKQLLDSLHKRELLLVLDNFEHLINEQSLDWLVGILTQAPGVKIVLTSRERLRLVEEHVYDLQGMRYPTSDSSGEAGNYSAVQLFLQQAAHVRPDFSPTDEDLAAIIRLCQLTQGMPLGIELAASGVRYASCAEILHQLQGRLDLAFGSWRNRPERHQSLQAVFEYSWLLLAAGEQAMARRLAVFQGPFDVAAAAAVTRGTPAQVALLYDKSFLQRADADRFDLHPLLRQFLAEKLAQAPAERDEARLRHADYYQQLLASAAGQGNMERYYHSLKSALDSNIDNVIAATVWLAERHDFSERRLVTLVERLNFYFLRHHRHEKWKVVFHQIIQALQANGDNSYEERWLIGHLAARMAYADIYLGAYQRARQRLEAILPEAYELENGALICACLRWLGLIALYEADFGAAFSQVEAAIEAVSAYDPQYRFVAYELLGQIALAAGQLARTRQVVEQRYTLALEMESYDEYAPRYELAVGAIVHRQGQLVEAQERLQKAMALARINNQPAEIIACLERLGQVTADLGDYEAAGRLLAEAEEMAEALKDNTLSALVARTRGWWAECQEQPGEARRCYEESLALWLKRDNQPELPVAQAHLGRICARLGDLATAERHLQRALETLDEWAGRGWPNPGGRALALLGLGVLRRAQGDLVAARQAFEEAWGTAESAGELYFGLQAAVELALLLAEVDEVAEAVILVTFVRQHEATTAHDRARLEKTVAL
ncbi:MAG: tetratricopeptide repeat protein [Chloroflexi bacterium]|nr:tetratricopeptide repeat protein [Chloroflexota bacterium]MCI0647798.1 tetratricopeptide repeat protein [Chloroflexota bacterium]